MQQPDVPRRDAPESWWSVAPDALVAALGSRPGGLSGEEAARRLERDGQNSIQEADETGPWRILLEQLRSPLVLILVFAAVVSMVVGEWTDAGIVLVVVGGSALLGFAQEYRATNAVAELRSRIRLRSTVVREGVATEVPVSTIVAGDIVSLAAGSLIPADGLVIEAHDFFVNQAVLTGETFPVEKQPGPSPAEAGLGERKGALFMGTSVSSGTARMVVAHTGVRTAYGALASRLRLRPPETEFERGIQQFGSLLTQVMFVMVLAVLALNILLQKPPVDSLLFALALAVGLTPELLPAIVSITLSYGATRMAKRGVIVRRLNAIENLGSMDVLCTDKTGTLTEGLVRLDAALDARGEASASVLRLAHVNAALQTGLRNALDDAVCEAARAQGMGDALPPKVDEVPWDFVRRRLSVVVKDGSPSPRLVTKGAFSPLLDLCTSWRTGDLEPRALGEDHRGALRMRFEAWSAQGYRVLAVASRRFDAGSHAWTRADERDLVFEGFLLFLDPPRKDAGEVLSELGARGVRLKVITGDNAAVARHVAEAVGLDVEGLTTGAELQQMRDEALWHLAERTTIFAEVDPNQKERIILALKRTGHVVGYMGDGINDAPALHAADVGISVDNAVDVAKASADFVLLEHSLDVLKDGIDEGRRTFANTMKYILTTISANFGNMFSMAAASVALPFLPLLAPQILLNNFLSDIPGAAIATDDVDPEMTGRPRRFDTRFIRDYMVIFGLVSSLFDVLTFAVLLLVFRASAPEFQTGWFVESLLTELVIALVVRTQRPFWRSRPGSWLLATTAACVALAVALPYAGFGRVFGFVPLEPPLLATVLLLTVLYVVAAEATKRAFFTRIATPRSRG